MRPDLDTYRAAVAAKRLRFRPRGLTGDLPPLCGALKPLQRYGIEFALRAGTAGIYYDTGLGKTLIELEWGRVLAQATGYPSVLHCPLAVVEQHADAAAEFAIEGVKAVREPAEMDAGVKVALINYEIAEKFDPALFRAAGLDEGSILKNFTGATKRMLVARYADTPFRISASATPAPNDHTEIGQQAEFLGVMRSAEMLSRFFINDTIHANGYRLKRPAIRPFWDWVASWAVCVEKPSDLGFSDDGYEKPPLEVINHTLKSDLSVGAEPTKEGQLTLFREPKLSATSFQREKKLSLIDRCDLAYEVIRSEYDEPWVIWVETDAEEEAMSARLKDAVAVRGPMPPAVKAQHLRGFVKGVFNHLIIKPSIAAMGPNWQHCARMFFVGESFSYERYYQALRRCWRFGQRRKVEAHTAASESERALRFVIARKEGDHQAMKAQMRAAMARIAVSHQAIETYDPQQEARLPAWLAA